MFNTSSHSSPRRIICTDGSKIKELLGADFLNRNVNKHGGEWEWGRLRLWALLCFTAPPHSADDIIPLSLQHVYRVMASLLPSLARSGRCNHCIFRACGEEGREGGLGLQYLETRRRHRFIRSAMGLAGLDSWRQLFRELGKQPAFRNG